MSGFLKSTFKSFGEVPKDKFPAEFHTPFYVRGYIFGNYAYPSGLLAHVLFLIIFSLLGVTPLAYFNIFSVILWASAIFIHRKGYLWFAYYLITFEIIAHAAICTAVIGWEAGFQYYVLVQPSVVFLLPGKLSQKTVIAAIYTFTFVAINYFANMTPPLIKLSGLYLALVNYGNIISVCALLAYLAYMYYRATITAEEKLKKEHEKANAALKARNRALERLNRELAEAADYVKTILPAPVTEGAIRTDWRCDIF
jgi:hypothetical protein